MNIRARLTLLIVLTFIALALIGGFAVFKSRSSTDQVKRVTTGVVPSSLASVELIGQLKDVQIATLDMVAAKEADQVTRMQANLKDKKSALEKALAQQLQQADSEAQKGLVKEAQESLVNYFSSIDDTVKFKLAGQNDMAQANLDATVAQYLKEQSAIIETVQIEKRRSKDEAITNLNESLTHTSTVLTLITLTAVLALTALGIFLYRQITVPMKEMEVKMTEIATTQDFTHRLPVTRQDEIGRSIVAFNAMIEKIQESSELVRQKNADIHAMLHNIPQGILTIVSGGKVHPEYSQYLESILETTDIGGRDVVNLLFSQSHCGTDIISQVEAVIGASIGEEAMNFEFNSHLLPTELEVAMPDGGDKILDLSWSAIANEADTVERLMLCVRDVTELRKLEAQAKKQQREMNMIGEILALDEDKFHDFLAASKQFITENGKLLQGVGEAPTAANSPETITLLFRNMHTIKGNARTYGLSYITNLVHETEQTYDDMRKAPDQAWDLELMREQLATTLAGIEEYEDLNFSKLGRNTSGAQGHTEHQLKLDKAMIAQTLAQIDSINKTDARAMALQLERIRHELQLLGTQHIESVLSNVLDSLPSLAAELNKAAPVSIVEDNGVVVRDEIADVLKNVFMHLYRNSLDHGIEDVAQRLSHGKPAKGTIRLSLSLDEHHLNLRLSDDGRGLALGFIKQRALETGLVSEGQALTDIDAAQLIFASGFSTAQKVTEVSGRGVGMDAVRGFIQSIGGEIALRFTSEATVGEFRAFETVIKLPAQLAAQSMPPALAAILSHETAVA